MLTEKMRIERKEAVFINADFTAPKIEWYALAWLKLTNLAREMPDVFYKIGNVRESSEVYVICNPKRADDVKNTLDGICVFYDQKTEETYYIGKVTNEQKIEIGVPVYEYDSDADLDDEEWEEDMDAAVLYWAEVDER